MIYEVASLTIDPAKAQAFEKAVAQAAPLFRDAQGCRSMSLERVIEDPARYQLVVGWDRLEDHMEHFRASPAFQQWRALAGPFFTAPPEVVHTACAADFF
ncbi:Antibiotic biosynthesis monooxygenase [Sphingomonas paucimobilis]|nr:Antibiotic biosynthesis monooxygenase [Sphingomonas paucimobilis]